MKTNNKKNKKGSKLKIIILIFIILMAILFYFFNNRIKSKTNSIIYYMYYPINYISEKISLLKDNESLIKENKKLLINIENKELILKKNNELEEEISELKELLKLKNIFTNYNIINCTIVSRNKNYWFNELTIDKGKKDGIEVNMAVVSEKGLIGKISNVYDKTSIIKMITNNDNNKISIEIENKNGHFHGIIDKYDISSNTLKVTGITNYDNVEVNDKVLTTGYGVFPKGIEIGKIKKIENDNYNISKVLYVELNQNMNNIKYVSILGNKIND